MNILKFPDQGPAGCAAMTCPPNGCTDDFPCPTNHCTCEQDGCPMRACAMKVYCPPNGCVAQYCLSETCAADSGACVIEVVPIHPLI